MEVQKARTVKNQKQVFQRYLFLITIISSMLMSGLIGYTTSHIVINNSVGGEPKEINTKTEFNTATEYFALKNQVKEARNNSLKVIDTELPKIISDLEKYNEDINVLVENIEWLKENLDLIRDSIGKIDSAFSVVKGVNTVVDIPIVGNIGDNLSIKISTNLALTKIQLDEINSILLDLENLTVIQKEMSDSHEKLNTLFEKYQKEKNIEQLLRIEQELNSNLTFQIDELRKSTIEARKVFELSSSVLITVDKTGSLFNSIKEIGKNTLDAIQFWKENEVPADINKKIEKDLVASMEKIQELPNELTTRSKSSISSISTVQRELQTIKIARMIITE
ncbi:hypothetical protein B14911_03384 [Bacillus sp. NRRL B-14911]|uniref:Uncharacterized protein n=1 Tax=Bacillus infantis NRRL B-14911 TaxID=1367477 RepID=U5LIL7_9BACI|nr:MULTISPECIES: hypothetical protein [Bacillus]AGX06477.1 hypothetical protein N288_23190 [Bacillus infantis NRRL B-14911]EAR68593.1 hypothetical protein B14911_03384 [Bacillus sp. NRRL B-14911]